MTIRAGRNWSVPIPVVLFLIGYGVGGVWWGGSMNARLGSLEQAAATQQQVRELSAQVAGLRRDVADNIVIRRRIWDRIERLERTTAVVDERTRGMNETIVRIYNELVKSREGGQ
ncbi:MAG: hypothetical protein ACMVY4_08015 [Minwuia sp.]|uniref:hypothetical protein n=1 Tax=Minwuia sp. TaxID=2493630 RepID=UPI003A89209E